MSEGPRAPPVVDKKRRVAVVGGGVSGLAAAWHLKVNCSDTHGVELFEADDRLGGHAHTIHVESAGVDVDVGFIVFNDPNYPNMIKWFEAMDIETEPSDMSLSISLDEGKYLEWSSLGLNGLFSKRSQILSPSFYTFLSDMMRFNAEAANILLLPKDDPRRCVTTGQYLRDHGYSDAFATHYLLPMMAALWSASMENVLSFPAEQLVGFLCNHKMLQLFDRPYWKTVANRSKMYTQKMKSILGESAFLSTPIVSAQKVENGTDNCQFFLFTTGHKMVGAYDEVVFACSPPIAAKILGSTAAPELTSLLSKLEYADNVVYLHSDSKLMPKRKNAWASWNCLGKSEHLKTNLHHAKSKEGESFEGGQSGFGAKKVENDNTDALEGEQGRMKAVYVTYWLNRLQNLKTDENIFVSLNPHQAPEPDLVHKKQIMAHPQFTPETLVSRQRIEEKFQGQDGLWFCGAWEGYGFHEDGCRSGFQVATKLANKALPWSVEREDSQMMVLPPPDYAVQKTTKSFVQSLYIALTRTIPVAICKRIIVSFLKMAIQRGSLQLKLNDGSIIRFGDGTRCGCDSGPVTLRIFDDWFFVKTATEYDLGMARSYMAGHFVVEPLTDAQLYDPVIRPPSSRNEITTVLGDPVGLTRLFLLFIGNRDHPLQFSPRKSGRTNSNAFTTASGLLLAKIGGLLNFVRYKLTMNNSERGGSLRNIHAHYDLSNDLFTTFLDKETLMYSSGIYDAVKTPSSGYNRGLVFRGTLEEAQWRKLDTLLDRAQIKPGQTVLDIGFGWGGLSLHAARKYGCQVTGITLSVEQKVLAEERVRNEGLEHLITFEVIDYRTFARRKDNLGKFDRVLSCEMIEAVGHEHLGEFFWAVERVLAYDGILVMEAITTPEQRYEAYRRSTDFINTIIFPGSCCPSLHALVDAAYQQSALTLEHIDNIGLHYAQTLAEWRRRFNANEAFVRSLGFDDVFLRVWNYYLTYCEAGFYSQTENCLILVFARQGCQSLVPLCETRSVTQMPSLTEGEVQNFLKDGTV